MQSLVSLFMNGENSLQLIQAVSLWGNDDQKITYLSLKNMVEITRFIHKTAGDTRSSLIEKQISADRRSMYFSRNYPFGNAYSVTFVYSNNICMLFNWFTFRLPR